MINPYSSVAAYIQVATDLRHRITRGELPPGAELPPYATLAEQYGVSPGTITRAIGRLRDAGLVETGTGFPTRVRRPMSRRTAVLPSGARVSARMPTPAEQEAHGIDPGVPMIVVTLPNGEVAAYPGDRWDFDVP